jgi:putative nucleotidyltransferase with HDIG domain
MLTESEVEELKGRLKEEFSGYTELTGGKNYRFHHLETTHEMVRKLSKMLDVELDMKVLEIAALFHDIGRAEDIEDGEMNPIADHEGHDERGAEIVEDHISDLVSENELDKIRKIIRNHHSSAETVEDKILQDCDSISNFGVSNLWRQFNYATNNEISLYESLDYFWNTAVKEFEEQIEELYFKESKEIAKERLEKHKQAVKQIEEEMNAEDF